MKVKSILIAVLGFSLFLSSCVNKESNSLFVDSSDIPNVNLKIHRYGEALFEIDTAHLQSGLKEMQDEFKIFLGADLDNPANVQQIYDFVSDSQLIYLYEKTREVYPNLNKVEDQLSDAFSRYLYFFPDQKLPAVYTYISDLYYEAAVFKADSALVVALDVYLGSDFPLYQHLGLPFYKIRRMDVANLPIDVMKEMYFSDLAVDYKQRTLLDRMIESGKMLYYLDAVMPNTADSLKVGYTSKKLDWAIKNEESVWAFLVGNELLYSTDYKTQTKLIQDGPFTTGFSNESPPRLGVFIGWQIVRSFMNQHDDVSLKQLLQMTDAQKILQESAYKP